MIGLVIISHSVKAAEGVAEVVAQMGGGNTRIVPTSDNEDGVRTSPDRIREGIEETGGGDGVVVLVDLDSAVMNTELVIETAMDSGAIIADAPVLEGTLNAAVRATSKKAMLDSVVKRAEDAHDYRRLN